MNFMDYNSWYEIPNASKYLINAFGTVMNIERGELLTGSFNPAGYLNYRLTNDQGIVCTIGRHRLMGLVFIPQPITFEKLVINHLNGIKGDDRLENLEWCTFKENQHHAGFNYLTSKCVPVSIRNIINGDVLDFPSMIECANYLGITKDVVAYRLMMGESKYSIEGYQFRDGRLTTDWVIDPLPGFENNGVLVRFITTGEIVPFDTQIACAEYLNISSATISQWLTLDNQPILPGLIQIKKMVDPSHWRDSLNPYFELEAFTKQRVVICYYLDGTFKIYQSAKDCAIAEGVTPTALNYRLNNCSDKFNKDGKKFSYYNSGPTER